MPAQKHHDSLLAGDEDWLIQDQRELDAAFTRMANALLACVGDPPIDRNHRLLRERREEKLKRRPVPLSIPIQ